MSRRLTRAQPLLDAALVARAFDLAAASIERVLVQPRASGERLLHVVVLDPQVVPPAPFEGVVLAERSFGQPPPWQADYRSFALAKARLAWRLQRDTRWVHQQAPHLLVGGDTTLWGSCWRDGLVVAASGAQPWFDEACSELVASLIVALARGGQAVAEP